MHDSVIVSIQDSGNYVLPVFVDSNINNITHKYTFTKFQKAVPKSRFGDVRQLYTVECNSTVLGLELESNFPEVFKVYGITPPAILCSTLPKYTPNDWISGSFSNPWTLDFIHAREAWALQDRPINPIPYSRGRADVLIGVTDTYFGPDHPDLMYKIAFYDDDVYHGAGPINHGNFVAGMAAAHADNGVGYPGVGFNCRLRVSTNYGNDGVMLDMSLPGVFKTRVLNASWLYGGGEFLNLEGNLGHRLVYDEIYENGVVTCVAAGNGYSTGNPPWYYTYPSSFDHVISTTHIGAKGCDWVEDGNRDNVSCLEHNVVHGDTLHRSVISPTVPYSEAHFNHNTRVDICAPAYSVGGLIYNLSASGDDRFWTSERTGTSFASPQTAGVIGLMASVKPCLSPYQLEWALKTAANPDIYSVADNAYLTTPPRLGIGRLDAYESVIKASEHDCNDPETQTMFIKGVEINTLCAPGFSSNSINPILIPKIENGVPPYTYRWEPLGLNTATLDSRTSATPTVISSTGTRLLYYYLTVTDNSVLPKVAHRKIKIQLKTENTYELASRDSYLDMMDEPNSQEAVEPREWHLWASPDVWNRQASDGVTEPQNVEYFSSGDSNYAYVRVRNVGCAAYNDAYDAGVHLYWTLQSTGESWPLDWTSADVAASGGGTVQAGREITTAGVLHVPDLQPGETYVGYRGWQPPNPTNYEGSPSSVFICYLARLWEPGRIQYGMYAVEGSGSTENVKNNNNIVTRNMSLVSLGRKKAPKGTRRVFVSNVSNVRVQTFSLQMLTERDIQLHFAGNPSQYMYVALHMDSGLYARWAAGGYLGSYASYSTNERTVYYDPATPLRLDGIELDTMEKHYIDMEFAMRDGVPVSTPFAPQTFHFRQLCDTNTADSVYGCVSFQLGIDQDDVDTRRGALVITEASQGADRGCQYIEMIAANCGTNMGEFVDLRGWIINDNAGWYGRGECDPGAVNRGHFRLSDDDVWAKVPVGSILVMYNNQKSCYGLQGAFEYNKDSGVYWIPIDSGRRSPVLQYTGLENSEVCTYCSDTGKTIYDTASAWKVADLDDIIDVAQTVCPGCSANIPVLPALYSAVLYVPGDERNFVLASDSSIGVMILWNNDSVGRYKYVFTGNSDEAYADTSKWVVAPADTPGAIPPTMGNVSNPLREQIIGHETSFPCCSGPSQPPTTGLGELGERKAPVADRRKNTVSTAAVQTIKVYPNPANTTVHFEFAHVPEMVIAIMDVTGKELERQTLHSTGHAAFDVRGYAPGLYIYQAIAGTTRFVGKVIVNR